MNACLVNILIRQLSPANALSRWHHYFACDLLHSYFDECQKNEIHLLYLHYFRNNFFQLKSTFNETIQHNNGF